MPYIKSEDKLRFAEFLADIPNIATPGELNYVVTVLATHYLKHKGVSYQSLNDVSGALTNANAELYRRLTAPYEDLKILENGEVYPKCLLDIVELETDTEA